MACENKSVVVRHANAVAKRTYISGVEFVVNSVCEARLKGIYHEFLGSNGKVRSGGGGIHRS